MRVDGGWHVGDEGRVVATFKDKLTGDPIEWGATTGEVTAKKPGGSEAPLGEAAEEEGGKLSAPIFFDAAGTWSGHIILTGEYRRRIPWSVQVAA